MIGRSHLTASLLLTMAKLNLWKPDEMTELNFCMRINLHQTLKQMGWDLKDHKL